MGREMYGDDASEAEVNLWHANLRRSKRGRRGRAALLELREALLALPHKRLIRDRLAANGDVCTVGAIVLIRKAKQLGSVELAQASLEDLDSWCDCQHRKGDHDDRGVCLTCTKLRADDRLANEYSRRSWVFGPYEQLPRPWSEAHWVDRWPPRHPYGRCPGFTPWVPHEDDEDDDGDSSLTLSMAKEAGIPDMLAWWLVAENDDWEYGLGEMSPEQRYAAVLRRVESDLREMGALA